MNLDTRIKSKFDILTCFDIEKAKEFVGQKGYFTDFIENYQNLVNSCYGTLIDIKEDSYTFRCEVAAEYWRFFIPESLLKPKEKKYRPYTFKEFKGLFPIGQPIKYRRKGNAGLENEIVLDGYSHEQRGDQIFTYIYIGVEEYTLQELFEDYEWLDPDTGEWDIFGVKE